MICLRCMKLTNLLYEHYCPECYREKHKDEDVPTEQDILLERAGIKKQYEDNFNRIKLAIKGSEEHHRLLKIERKLAAISKLHFIRFAQFWADKRRERMHNIDEMIQQYMTD